METSSLFPRHAIRHLPSPEEDGAADKPKRMDAFLDNALGQSMVE